MASVSRTLLSLQRLLSLAVTLRSLPTAAAAAIVGVRIEAARSAGDLRQAADAFALAFWGDGISSNLRQELARQHLVDMEERYGELVGARRLASQLLIARAEASSEIVGLCGCELAVVDTVGPSVLPRRRGEALFKDRLAMMGARERNGAHARAPLHARPHGAGEEKLLAHAVIEGCAPAACAPRAAQGVDAGSGAEASSRRRVRPARAL